MRPMTAGERQLLIALAEEFPLLRDEMMRKLVADNQLRRAVEQEAADRQYSRWRATEIARRKRGRLLAKWFGPLLTVGGSLSICRILWLMVHDAGGGVVGLVLWSLLTLFGGGLWLGSGDPLELPPPLKEIRQKVAHFGKVSGGA